jgi:hypothetical protein
MKIINNLGVFLFRILYSAVVILKLPAYFRRGGRRPGW